MPVTGSFSNIAARSYGLFGQLKSKWLLTIGAGSTRSGPMKALAVKSELVNGVLIDKYFVVGSTYDNQNSAGEDAVITSLGDKGVVLASNVIVEEGGGNLDGLGLRSCVHHLGDAGSINTAYFAGVGTSGGSVFAYNEDTPEITWRTELRTDEGVGVRVSIASILQPNSISTSNKNTLIVLGSYLYGGTYRRGVVALLNTETGALMSHIGIRTSTMSWHTTAACWREESGADKYYVTGRSTSYAVLWKLSSNIATRDWTKAWGITGSIFNDVCESDSGVYCAGAYRYNVDGSVYTRSDDVPVLAKFNESGSLLWAVGHGNREYKKVISDENGDIYALHAGGVHKYNSSGTLLWQRSLAIGGVTLPSNDSGYEHYLYGIAINSKNQLVLTGMTSSFGVIALNSDGTLESDVIFNGYFSDSGVIDWIESSDTAHTLPQTTVIPATVSISTSDLDDAYGSEEWTLVDTEECLDGSFKMYRF